jgi:DNA adenine methylase
MNILTMKAKPFVKWVGGKTQLIDQLEAMLPADFDQWENVTYIELLFLNMEKFL